MQPKSSSLRVAPVSYLSPISLMTTDVKILSKIIKSKIQNYAIKIIHNNELIAFQACGGSSAYAYQSTLKIHTKLGCRRFELSNDMII